MQVAIDHGCQIASVDRPPHDDQQVDIAVEGALSARTRPEQDKLV